MLKGFCLLRSDLCPTFMCQNDKRNHIQSETCHLCWICTRILLFWTLFGFYFVMESSLKSLKTIKAAS